MASQLLFFFYEKVAKFKRISYSYEMCFIIICFELNYQADNQSQADPNQKSHTYFLWIAERPSSKFLGRSSAVNNVCLLKILYKASLFTNTISDENG